MNFTAENLTELAEQNPDELVRIIAEVCYGLNHGADDAGRIVYGNLADFCDSNGDSIFNPLAKTVHGRSQAFELMILFKIEVCFSSNEISYQIKNPKDTRQPYDWFEMSENLQKDICIACILTAQEMK